MRYREISEARRGGRDLNPRVNPISVLKKYVNSGYYMSYTSIDKLGINPRSGYNTPIGIYSYPIEDRVVGGIIAADDLSRVPYMGEAPYIWIFKPKNADRGLIIRDYVGEDYEGDVDLLYKYFRNADERISSAFDAIKESAQRDARINSAVGYLWNFTRILGRILAGDETISRYTVEILPMGAYVKHSNEIALVIDVYNDSDEYEIEYIDGETATVKFDGVTAIPKLDSDKYEKLFDQLYSIKNTDAARVNISNPNAKYELSPWMIYSFNSAYGIIKIVNVENDERRFITVDRLLNTNPRFKSLVESFVVEYKKESQRAKSAAVMWTHLLHRVLGYDYVDDSDGSGLIHANEPVQAVFFGRNVIEVVERLTNPNSSNDTVTVSSLFRGTKSVDEVERIDPKITEQLFREILKTRSSFSSSIPIKFMGHIVINSSRLKAKVILYDYGMYDYFKTIGSDTIRIMDDYMISKINRLPSGNLEMNHTMRVWNYFNIVHRNVWPEGERAILNKAYSDTNPAIIVQYINGVRKKPWPEAEFIILKRPSWILEYSRILGKRWPEGERVLARLDRERASWVLEDYAGYWRIGVDDIGKV